ncbi:hypothetical protein [Winogradskyella sp. SYSU M77433]|uniref:hypothetical protein n=1 Tax=Winogradskyella sp. SYSU M77433 TaxID=3042722 RepID=UPI00247FDCFF|nr:hypothetical protein [Winogradskyella sp. SYSU M77433]MDH7912062.1 hypothetical protein [Winogradskyella sp. SYSU M77433]
MKKTLVFILLCLVFQANYSQEQYSIENEELTLTTEIEGTLDLLWTVDNKTYRYFVRTEDGTITELKNTEASKGNYLAEYKTTLSNLTDGKSTENLRFTLYGLKRYISDYNSSQNQSYVSTVADPKLGFRLGIFGGFTNHPFIKNPDNTIVPLIAGELEIFEGSALPRHSGFLQARHTFDADDFNYSTNELALGYRYRIINKSAFSIFGQVKLATLNFSSLTYTNENDREVNNKNTSFEAPLIFGIGSDIKVGNNSYISIIYGELFAVFLNNQGDFSSDIMLGYKFNL